MWLSVSICLPCVKTSIQSQQDRSKEYFLKYIYYLASYFHVWKAFSGNRIHSIFPKAEPE